MRAVKCMCVFSFLCVCVYVCVVVAVFGEGVFFLFYLKTFPGKTDKLRSC